MGKSTGLGRKEIRKQGNKARSPSPHPCLPTMIKIEGNGGDKTIGLARSKKKTRKQGAKG
jgi:hypothetical protein